jgi:hypothetical protein
MKDVRIFDVQMCGLEISNAFEMLILHPDGGVLTACYQGENRLTNGEHNLPPLSRVAICHAS